MSAHVHEYRRFVANAPIWGDVAVFLLDHRRVHSDLVARRASFARSAVARALARGNSAGAPVLTLPDGNHGEINGKGRTV